MVSSTDEAITMSLRCRLSSSRCSCFMVCSSEAAGDVLFCLLLCRPRIELIGGAQLNQVSLEEKCRLVGNTRRLLHVVRDDDNRVMLPQLEDQVLDAGSRGGVQG